MDLELLKQQTPSAYPTVATAMGTYAFYAFASYAADAVGSRSVTGSGSLYYLRHYGTNGTTAIIDYLCDDFRYRSLCYWVN